MQLQRENRGGIWPFKVKGRKGANVGGCGGLEGSVPRAAVSARHRPALAGLELAEWAQPGAPWTATATVWWTP